MSDEFGNCVKYNSRINICFACESSGDFNGSNDFIIAEAFKELKLRTVTTLISNISIKDINFTAVERILGLPFGTIEKWRRNPHSVSPEGFALLKAINKISKFLEKMDTIKKKKG